LITYNNIDTQGTLEEEVTNSDIAERKVGLDDEGKAEAERRITQIALYGYLYTVPISLLSLTLYHVN
jgi:hypothetical protein